MNEFDSIELLEATIRQAGNYVQPTDDLRPKTLEAARAATSQRRTNWRAGSLVAAVLLVAVAQASPYFDRPDPKPIMATAVNHEFALRQQTLERGVNSSWALYEAFCELRSKQAHLLKDSL
ncbi:hypothetical protein [Bythopirellula goksoeyrii]|uniref:Uncharacterized protein n=1 Tax=Bythopirellula goksoeyrii TaxID=1400387 RepID=A0A5B9QKK5_9BACT|nr:hypothetical protein [Bythopirellula goksoeyrii]QEG34671.1 hypothetical protein Pr1d_19530 [Bythopirellula goksoeyrii]